MGFADLSIAEIAVDYSVPVEKVLSVCDQLGIAYKNHKTRLALEDAKAIISQILLETSPNVTGTLRRNRSYLISTNTINCQ